MPENERPIRNAIKIRPKVRLPDIARLTSERDLFTGRLHVVESNNFSIPNEWEKIPAIHETRNVPQDITNLERLRFLVELPLYEAAVLLNQANIETTESNAHFEPNQTETLITLGIKWESLKPHQKAMANRLMQEQPDRWVHIPAAQHGDGYEAFYLRWKVKKDEVSPNTVAYYAKQSVRRLINGLFKI